MPRYVLLGKWEWNNRAKQKGLVDYFTLTASCLQDRENGFQIKLPHIFIAAMWKRKIVNLPRWQNIVYSILFSQKLRVLYYIPQKIINKMDFQGDIRNFKR